MYFLLKIFYFSLALNYIACEAAKSDHDGELDFQTLTLGNSGVLIYWQPKVANGSNEEDESNYCFEFGKRNSDEGARTKLEFSERICALNKWTNTYKIHSLNENTLYEFVIQQYFNSSENQPLRRYTIQARTNNKTNTMPAKPDFRLNWASTNFYSRAIQWLPCGKEKNCDGKEPGTHFGVKIKALDNSELGETRNDEYEKDFQEVIFRPGTKYEVCVFSVNGDSKTDCDSRRMFIKPKSSPVRSVKILSMPNSSVLIYWEKPESSVFGAIFMYHIAYSSSRQNGSDIRDQLLYSNNNDRRIVTKEYKSEAAIMHTIIPNITAGIEYTYSIVPVIITHASTSKLHLGNEYRVKHTLQPYKDEMQIAKPDFIIIKGLTLVPDRSCDFTFAWLPCGQSWNCGNFKPGSNFTMEVKPAIRLFFKDDYGNYKGEFLYDEYNITIRSWFGNVSSEPETKILKECSLQNIEYNKYQLIVDHQ